MVSLDFVRGIAVMGILLMNIIGFGLPELAYYSPSVAGGTAPLDIAAWASAFLLVDGKMRGIFSLLFGAGIALMADRNLASERSPLRWHYARMFWLALFGLLHFYALWMGDILFLYAAVGCLAYLTVNWSSELLMRRALFLYLIGIIANLGIYGSMLWLQREAQVIGADPEIVAQYRGMMAGFATDSAALAREIAIYQGGYGDILRYKLTAQADLPFKLIALNIGETLPLMMIGIALYRNGFLTGTWEPRDYRYWGLRLTGGGLLWMLALLGVQLLGGFDIILALNVTQAWAAPALLAMSVGYAALLTGWVIHSPENAIVQRVVAVGRMAFSNYIATSIIMCTIFYGWGFGLFGILDRAQLYLFVLPVWAVMLLWSPAWLSTHANGPFEALWRWLIRRSAGVSAPVSS